MHSVPAALLARIASFARATYAVALPPLRACLLTYVLLTGLLHALPEQPIDEARLERPAARRLVKRAQRALRALGIETSRDAIRARITSASNEFTGARARIVAPVAPLFEFVGSRQRWGLFLQGGRSAHRLQIEGRSEDGSSWTLLYRAHQYDALGLSSTLAYRRVRGIYNPRRPNRARAQYDTFSDWVAAEVWRRRPELRAVRVSMQRIQLGTRDAPPRELGVELERVRTRGAS